ncbi:hypothetical protein LCGC14_2441940 [marine sediment metagenome]|uniref:Uncharacterized protein n=1 Tax=marine sediment metagenome TaxID=412755 RepID=A0A0F9C668_9ZZZZ
MIIEIEGIEVVDKMAISETLDTRELVKLEGGLIEACEGLGTTYYPKGCPYCKATGEPVGIKGAGNARFWVNRALFHIQKLIEQAADKAEGGK